MNRTDKQEKNIKKGVDKMKVSKEVEVLTEAEWAIGEAFENGSFDLEDRTKLVEIRKEINDMWKKHMNKGKNNVE
jgi:hypothetical protein